MGGIKWLYLIQGLIIIYALFPDVARHSNEEEDTSVGHKKELIKNVYVCLSDNWVLT